MENEIKKLFEESKNSSSKWEKYFDIYESVFNKYKDRDVIFVEIGVHNGGSLEIWRNYFSKGSKIIGIDINEECKKFEDKNRNIEIYIGNQSDENFWSAFFKKVGKVDIILDDGGHTNLNQIITITVKENPTINLVLFEGNKSKKDEDLIAEIKLVERSVFSRSKIKVSSFSAVFLVIKKL